MARILTKEQTIVCPNGHIFTAILPIEIDGKLGFTGLAGEGKFLANCPTCNLVSVYQYLVPEKPKDK